MFGGNFAPLGHAFCSGQLLRIDQNDALFSLIGTTYGGDGQTTFGLTDLHGRIPLHFGSSNNGASVSLGQKGGEETHTLTIAEMPAHSHTSAGSNADPDATTPVGNFWAKAAGGYSGTADGAMSAAAVGDGGGGQGHENRSPYLAVTICIALVGIFPSRN